ncbi:transcription repressor OFP14 [Cicer arietinum]|uniref:Transcription repressor n=1 Tax=Cicer arietinum TaxID=3827 RepID=A0A1S2XBE5_CICAR|nr:transcription repressor OFP14 [Cicer arietinum]
MPNKLQKTLQDYLNKIKYKNPHPQIKLTKMLSGCKHPKTPSFSLENGRTSNHVNVNVNVDDAATLADVDRFLFENFKSLYFKDDEETENNTNKNIRISENEEPQKLDSFLFESPRLITTPRPDLCRSTRFFMKPGNSGSLMEDALSLTNSDEGGSSNSNSSSTASPSKEAIIVNDHSSQSLPENCVALLTYSPSPYDDFRRSMQDVVESKYGNIENNQSKIDWDFMEEILFCYLKLNEKKSHKFILSAFVDLITVMRRNLEAAPAKPCSVRTVRIGREVVRKKKTKQFTIQFESS